MVGVRRNWHRRRAGSMARNGERGPRERERGARRTVLQHDGGEAGVRVGLDRGGVADHPF
jgi:hypothetical protein